MLLSNRIRRRLRATGKADFESYSRLLQSPRGRDELNDFLSAVTTNETSFFRTEKHFDWLKTRFVEDLLARVRHDRRSRQIRIWSAACSTGEELYSIAICLAEQRPKLLDWTIELHGTDISTSALDGARGGVYSADAVSDVRESLRSKYFQHDAGSNTWSVRPVLRDMVTLTHHNLMRPFREGAFDAIFVRNVLIYFSRESKQVVIDHLVRSLAPDGYLVVGPSEGIYDMLGMLQKRETFLYQKSGPVNA
jgi:chemotaxis protein methyltransferase CheR